MAKKVAVPTDKFKSDKPHNPAGWKNCPSCNGWVKGPTTKTCPNCQHEFEFKARVRAATPAAPKEDLAYDTMMFALKSGGVESAQQQIAALEENPVMDFAIKAGGIDKAKSLLGQLSQKIG